MEENKKRIREFMEKYGVKKFPIYFDKNGGKTYLGELSGESLKFSSHFYNVNDKEWMYQQAANCIPLFEAVFAKMQTEITTDVDYYSDYKKKSTETRTATFDKLCEDVEKANNHLRYCNGSYYKFADKQMEQDYCYWSQLIPYYRSFHLYYGNGIVD